MKKNLFTKNVVNLSKMDLCDKHTSLLPKGLNFVPICNSFNKVKSKLELEAFWKNVTMTITFS